MAHLWTEGEAGRWTALAIDASSTLALTKDGARPADGRSSAHGPLLLCREKTWFLLAPRVRDPCLAPTVNGDPLVLGVRELADRDSLRVGRARWYFSTEQLADVVAYAGEPTRCARCRQELHPGARAVACPTCGAWHHEGPLPCWSYPKAKSCARCDHPTARDAGFRWAPDHGVEPAA